jgi:hypothetical protein
MKDKRMTREFCIPSIIWATIIILSTEPALPQSSIGGPNKQNSLGGPAPPKSLVLPPRNGEISPPKSPQVKVRSGEIGAARKPGSASQVKARAVNSASPR